MIKTIIMIIGASSSTQTTQLMFDGAIFGISKNINRKNYLLAIVKGIFKSYIINAYIEL